MHKSYKKPPIVEAVIEIRFDKQISQTNLQKIIKKLKKTYPIVQETSKLNISIDESNNAPKVERKPHGFRLLDDDSENIAILTNHSITTSRLAPYCGWDIFSTKNKENFNNLHSVTGTININRIGIRFINRIDIPNSITSDHIIEYSDYVTCYPKIPNTELSKLINYNMNLAMIDSEKKIKTIITTGINESPLFQHTALFLDIDISIEENIPLKSDEIFSLIDRLREVKNRTFEDCLTNTCRELFNS